MSRCASRPTRRCSRPRRGRPSSRRSSGRHDDNGFDGMDLIRDIRLIYDNYAFDTEILVASVRHAVHVLESAKIGADVMTAPPAVIKGLFKHVLTDKGIEGFLADWAKTGPEHPVKDARVGRRNSSRPLQARPDRRRRALAHEPEVEVAWTADAPTATRQPTCACRCRAASLPPEQVREARGFADGFALQLRHHNEALHDARRAGRTGGAGVLRCGRAGALRGAGFEGFRGHTRQSRCGDRNAHRGRPDRPRAARRRCAAAHPRSACCCARS